MANSVSDLPLSLTASEVQFRIKDNMILDDAFISVPQGSITVLLGPNGAGKTTLLSILQGLTKPDAGKISLLGENPTNSTPSLRSRVGVMLQDGGLPQAVTPLRLLRHIGGFYKSSIDVSFLMEQLSITEFQKTPIRHLSGGQKQRVAMAAALIGKPEFIFMDEPSSGLDPQSRQQIGDFIVTLREAGMTILLTTHLLLEAERLADFVYLLNQGKTVAHGTVAELTQLHQGSDRPLILKPLTPLNKDQLTALENVLPNGKVHTDQFSTSNPSYLIEGCCGAEDLSRITKLMADLSIQPQELHFRSRTLEDVFFEVANSQQEVVS